MLRSALMFALILMPCFVSLQAETDQSKRPNFIVIMADDMGYADASCYGNDRYQTPHLDALARNGMRFTDFHTSGTVCSPTRAGLLTGRYQQRVGIPGVVFADPKRPAHRDGLQTSEITFAEPLKAAGYATAIVGKWHLGYYPKYNPVRHGFDLFRGYVSGNIDFFSHYDQAGNYDWWDGENKIEEEGYTTHLITKHAVKFIKQNKDKPFCLYVPHEAPHYPYQGPNDKAERIPGQKFVTLGARKDRAQAYAEMMEEMDKGIGEIVATVKQLGLSENTLIMFLSDNGATSLGNNGPLRGTKGQVWEGGHRVPFIASWPGKIKPGTVSDSMTFSLDIMPTMLSLANATVPEGHHMDGVDLTNVLFKGESNTTRKMHWYGRAMRDGKWKLIAGGGAGRPKNGPIPRKPIALYDLSTDIGESTNVAADHPDRVKNMLAAMAAWEEDVKRGATVQPSHSK